MTASPEKQDMKARILETADRLFYLQGIRAVGVDEIVSESGVTKPSLYRSFPSKDELAASYLRDYEQEFWNRFDASIKAHPGDPRAQLMAFFERLSSRAARKSYRGCGLTNAAVEFQRPGTIAQTAQPSAFHCHSSAPASRNAATAAVCRSLRQRDQSGAVQARLSCSS